MGDVSDFLKDAVRATGNFITFGAIDRIEAKEITQNARERETAARQNLEKQKEKTQKGLTELGQVKQQAFQESLMPFVSVYKEVGNVDLKPIKHIDELDYRHFKCEYAELKQVTALYQNIAIVGGGVAALTGAAAVGGALGLAALIGTASTGTAIGTLSGVAATNATLAWLGGGSLAAGGFGVAGGGMVVLGGIALAPLAVFCMFLGTSKGKQALNAANNYSDQVDVLVERVETLIQELKRIDRGADLCRKTIISLNQLLIYQNSKMQTVIDRLHERDAWHKFLIDPVRKLLNMQILTDEEAAIFQDTANCAYLLKRLIDTPLMNKDGSFFEGAMESFQNCNRIGKTLLDRNPNYMLGRG